MIDLIRTSSVPATLMQAAARGALSVPPEEMIEILVHLANHNKLFGQQARMTLAGWDEKSSLAAAANPDTPPEVLDYLSALENLRPHLLPVLLENPSVSDSILTVMATTGSREVVEAMRRSPRVQNSPPLLHAITSNPNATVNETAQLHQQLVASGFEESMPESESTAEGDAVAADATGDRDEADEGVTSYLAEHAKEIDAEDGKPFQPLGDPGTRDSSRRGSINSRGDSAGSVGRRRQHGHAGCDGTSRGSRGRESFRRAQEASVRPGTRARQCAPEDLPARYQGPHPDGDEGY